MKILDFEWDEGNTLHLQLGHGIEPQEAEEVFAARPLFKRTKKGIMQLLVRHPKDDICLLFLNGSPKALLDPLPVGI